MSTAAKQQTPKEEVTIIKAVLHLNMQYHQINVQEIARDPEKLKRYNDILNEVRPFCISVINLSQGNLDALGIFSSQAYFRGESEVYELLASLQTKEFNPKQRKKREFPYVALKWEREIIRIFERIIRQSFERVIENLPEGHPFIDQFDEFVNKQIGQEKAPHLIMAMICQDRNYLCKIYDPILAIGKDNMTAQEDQLLRIVASVIDPAVSMPSMTSLLKHLTQMLTEKHKEDFITTVPYVKFREEDKELKLYKPKEAGEEDKTVQFFNKLEKRHA